MIYDLILKNGRIIDGTGNPWFRSDIGIKNRKIAHIGTLKEQIATKQTKIIDVHGLIISPGFIDMHSHADLSQLSNPTLECLVRQGITTVVTGNCGGSLAPLNPDAIDEFQKLLEGFANIKITWNTFKEYLSVIDGIGCSANLVPLVGFSSIRQSFLGQEDRDPTDSELEKMKAYVEEAMQAGAFGFSTGLIYSPQLYAKTNEIIELAKIAGRYNGLYCSHLRNEADHQIEAIQEFLEIVEKSNCVGGQLSHHKIEGPNNWGMSKKTLKMVADANEKGLNIRVDQYPYIRGSNGLADDLPGWAREGGFEKILERIKNPETKARIKKEMEDDIAKSKIGWDKIFVASVQADNWKDIVGLSIAEITKIRNRTDNFSTFCDIIIDDKARTTKTMEYGHEDDIARIMTDRYTMIGSDAWAVSMGEGIPHPRLYGTYPRILGKYVREEQIISLEIAIKKMTSFPAQTMGLYDRGMIREGMWADLVVFDEKTVIDKATYTDPHQYPEGIFHVIVNGEFIVENCTHTGALPGKILRKPL